MTKAQIISQINAITTEFCGSQLAGLNNQSKEALAAKLVGFEQMIAHHRNFRAVMEKLTVMQQKAFALMAEDAPVEFQEAWQEQVKALAIWRNH